MEASKLYILLDFSIAVPCSCMTILMRICSRSLLAMDHLADILQSIGIPEYLDRFIEAGFSTWEALLDITEDEL